MAISERGRRKASMSESHSTVQLHCFARQEGEHYIAMCLELDIAVQADSLDQAKTALNSAVKSYLETVVQMGESAAHLTRRPAPRKYWMQYRLIAFAQWISSHIHRPPSASSFGCTFEQSIAY